MFAASRKRGSNGLGASDESSGNRYAQATATMGTTVIVSTAMSDDIAYTITKTINDDVDRLRKLHDSLADYDPSRGWLHLGVAIHPGAERYYREKGWLK
jgi:TRAP-type uncharacterized transport system substrate-binding protein